MNGYKMGIDVGGTFTDGVLIDSESGKVLVSKVPTTPSDPSIGFLNAVDRILNTYGIDPQSIDFLVHGTTIATNSVIERKIAKTALITTRGFRDILEIAFQIRPRLYDVFVEKPVPLIPRHLCFEVTERLDAEGKVITELIEGDVLGLVNTLQSQKVESVVICLLHSYANNKHEKKVGDILTKKLPGVYITLSSDICNEFREYTRASTAVVNGAIIPIVSEYLDRIQKGLQKRGINREFHLMASSGGIVTSDIARNKPAYIVESGPAAGVIVGQYLGELIQTKDLLALDMGGTTAKIGMILDGQARITRELEVGSAATARSMAKRANGYPLRTPSIDLVEIGAGGGSIAWVDSGGILRVGPESAGAIPGPACYPEGGDKPTITDANVVMGRLNPDYFLGGEIKLIKDKSFIAIKEFCADKVCKSVVETAAGIVTIAVSNMVNAVRSITVERGYDPRDFSLVTTGGAGALHCNLIARELGITRIIVPKNQGIASALGLLVTDAKQELSTTVANIRDLNIDVIINILWELENKLRTIMENQRISQELIEIQAAADLHYLGQSYEITINFDVNKLKQEGLAYLTDIFHKEHQRAYGFSARGDEVKIVSLKQIGIGKIKKHVPIEIQRGFDIVDEKAKKEVREVYLDETGEYTKCCIYDREHLRSGNVIIGPAIVEEVESTTLILPYWQAEVDKYGNLIVSKRSWSGEVIDAVSKKIVVDPDVIK